MLCRGVGLGAAEAIVSDDITALELERSAQQAVATPHAAAVYAERLRGLQQHRHAVQRCDVHGLTQLLRHERRKVHFVEGLAHELTNVMGSSHDRSGDISVAVETFYVANAPETVASVAAAVGMDVGRLRALNPTTSHAIVPEGDGTPFGALTKLKVVRTLKERFESVGKAADALLVRGTLLARIQAETAALSEQLFDSSSASGGDAGARTAALERHIARLDILKHAVQANNPNLLCEVVYKLLHDSGPLPSDNAAMADAVQPTMTVDATTTTAELEAEILGDTLGVNEKKVGLLTGGLKALHDREKEWKATCEQYQELAAEAEEAAEDLRAQNEAQEETITTLKHQNVHLADEVASLQHDLDALEQRRLDDAASLNAAVQRLTKEKMAQRATFQEQLKAAREAQDATAKQYSLLKDADAKEIARLREDLAALVEEGEEEEAEEDDGVFMDVVETKQ